jgi:dienelactone hydrolase
MSADAGFASGRSRTVALGSRGRPEKPPQGLEKMDSAPGLGRPGDGPSPQDAGRGRGASFARGAPEICAAALLGLLGVFPAVGAERVEFPSAAASGQTGAPLQGELVRPKGAGPFPAAVLIPTCLGLPANRQSIESALAGAGFVALFVDEFATRGLKETCAVDFPQSVADAYGALAFLGRRPDVDPRRIAAIGFSQGGDAALTIATERGAAAFALPENVRFRAAAAFYPPCANQGHARLALPTLIVIGDDDRVTPAGDCERLARRQGANVRLVVLAGAGHGFDDPEFSAGRPVFGMSLAYDAAAARKGMGALIAFLGKALSR